MFWRKKQVVATTTESAGGTAVSKKAEPQPPKAKKKLSLKNVIVEEIAKLGVGQSVSRVLHPTYGGGVAIVTLNTDYPKKGHKYIISIEKMVDNKPTGQRTKFMESDKPKELADWIIGRAAEAFPAEHKLDKVDW